MWRQEAVVCYIWSSDRPTYFPDKQMKANEGSEQTDVVKKLENEYYKQ